MLNDDAYFILSDGIPNLIDQALEVGESFDAIIEELRAQIDLAVENREEYGA